MSNITRVPLSAHEKMQVKALVEKYREAAKIAKNLGLRDMIDSENYWLF